MCISLIHYQCISVIIYVYMKSFLKLLSKLLFALSILFLQASFASAYCVGQPVTLAWSITSGVATACPTRTADKSVCSFEEAASAFTSSKTITAPNGGCTVNFQCSNASGNSNLDSATLSVDSSQVWNGSACVAPAPVTWTSYCPLPNDPNGNVNRMWQYSNASPVGYRDASSPCCSATGALGALGSRIGVRLRELGSDSN